MEKIGLLIDTMNSGGAQRVVSHLSRILSEDFEVYVILFEDTYQEYVCNCKCCYLQVPAQKGCIVVKLNLLCKRIVKLRELIQKEKLDCVISFLDSPNFVNLLAGVSTCKKIISIRNYSRLENRDTLLKRLTDLAMKYLYRQADVVITVSKLIEMDFTSHYGIPKKKLKTIYNPYNFQEIWEKADELLNDKESDFFSDHFVFSNVGRIMYQKGVWHLIKAFSLVNQKEPDARLVIVGEDLSGGKVQKLIRQLNLERNILLTGRTKNPYKYMKNADCYVLSSMFEGFPNAMVEAMACGCAVIAADCKSGPREILYENPDLNETAHKKTDADYGVLVPTLEVTENWDPCVITDGERIMAEAMIEFVHNEQKRKCYAQAAQKRSLCFDYESCRKQYKSVIDG